MKKIYKFTFALFAVLFNISFSFSQDVCLVSTDFQDGDHYMVVWEKPAVVNGIDSVYIYRMQGTETFFTKVGAKHMNELSFYTDMTSNTMDSAKYAISYLYSTGLESVRSAWHQGVVLDYSPIGTSEGTLIWSKYKKENQIDEFYILSYNCMMDQTGLGAFVSMGFFMNYETSWWDPSFTAHPLAQYYIETNLPSCSITKANINTSRSNIKRQSANAEASVEEQLFQLNIGISPNPADEELQISFDEKLLNAQIILTDAAGKIFYENRVISSDMEINISQFHKGIYFMNVEKNGRIISKTFLKN